MRAETNDRVQARRTRWNNS